MATFCCCGNGLKAGPDFKVTLSPCACEVPGPGRRALRQPVIHEFVFKKQWEDRQRLGLPIETDTEIGVRKRWHSG